MDRYVKEWLLNLHAVVDGRVLVDVRGPNPIMLKRGTLIASSVESKDDVVDFLIRYLD